MVFVIWRTGMSNSSSENTRTCITCNETKSVRKFDKKRKRCSPCRGKSQRNQLANPKYTGNTCARCPRRITHWNKTGFCVHCRKRVPKTDKACELCEIPYTPTIRTQRWCKTCLGDGKYYGRLRAFQINNVEWDKRVQQQNGMCAICKTRPPIVVDHNHKTNMIRGLLCNRCNTVLGAVELEGWVDKAKDYLSHWESMEMSPSAKRADASRTIRRDQCTKFDGE